MKEQIDEVHLRGNKWLIPKVNVIVKMMMYLEWIYDIPEAFKGSNVKTIIIKSKKLTKQSVKNAFKGLKVKKLIVKVKVG